MPSLRPPSRVRRAGLAILAGAAGACATPEPPATGPGADLVHVHRCGERRVETTPEGDALRPETDGGLEAECTRVAVRDAAGPLPFLARGNEPGWHLDIAPRRMTLVTDYGARRVELPRPRPVETPTGQRYAASTPEHGLTVAIEERTCRDDMSGMPYPRTVVVTLDGRRLRGCGGEPAALLAGDWVVERLAGEPASEPPPTLRFGEDGSLAGSTSCNRYTTGYTLTGETLTTGAIATTRRACAPERMAQESRFTALLGAIRRFDLAADGALRLETDAGDTSSARRAGTIRAPRAP